MTLFATLKARLDQGRIAILNGAMGTEIQARGIPTTLPLWSAGALDTSPDIVRQIHVDYIDAGAHILTTNTFRTNERTMKHAGLPATDAIRLTSVACKLAFEAREQSGKADIVIGGEMAPLEDCYRLDLVPSDAELHREHARWAESLAACGVDCIFVETMNCIRETAIAVEEASKTGLPILVSFLSTLDGKVFSGESIEDMVRALEPYHPFALLLNCRPPQNMTAALDVLLKASEVPVGVYANGIGHPDDKEGWIFEDSGTGSDKYLAFADEWAKKGARILGACCGSTPEYIRKIAERFN